MVHEVQTGRLCDSLRRELEKEVISYGEGVRMADTVIKVLEYRLRLERAGGAVMQSQAIEAEKRAEAYRKELRRQKRRTVIVGGIGVIVALLAGLG